MHGLDVVFEHAVKLKGLAVGEADGAIQGLRAGKLVDAQPLFGLDNATGQTAAQHHVFERLELLRHTLGADVAIVLLIHAVKADKLEIVAAKAAGEAIDEIVADAALEIMALAFEALVVGRRRIGQLGAGVGRVAHGASL